MRLTAREISPVSDGVDLTLINRLFDRLEMFTDGEAGHRQIKGTRQRRDTLLVE